MDEAIKMRILFLEDNPDDVELVRYALLKDAIYADLHQVDSKQEFVQALRSNSFDVILSDHSLPQFNSIEALRLCNRAHVQVPFILVTGTVSEEFAVKCLKQGADDYVLKSNLTRLPLAINNSIKQRKLMAERTSAEQALRQQNKELSKINQELDSFVYSVSHNIRAPLLSVLGLVNLLRIDRETGGNTFDDYLQMMERSVQRLDGTLKDILDYSRNARLEVQVSPIDLEALIDDCIEKVKFLDGFETMSVQKEFSGKDIPFYSDPHRVSMMFANLLSNAVKYRDTSKPHSWISVRAAITRDQAIIHFQDNGIGAKDTVMEKIFQMFFRGTEKSEGAGLGLYIVKEAIDKLNGSIQASSKLGEGTTFTLSIPNDHKKIS